MKLKNVNIKERTLYMNESKGQDINESTKKKAKVK